jgi:hypothetical protein
MGIAEAMQDMAIWRLVVSSKNLSGTAGLGMLRGKGEDSCSLEGWSKQLLPSPAGWVTPQLS